MNTLFESSAIEKWLQRDIDAGVPEEHRQRVLWNGKADSRNSVLMIHGLYNSPVCMGGLAEIFAESGVPVVLSRLAGHYEQPSNSLHQVDWQKWFVESKSDLALARSLGEKVILVGHSTGALLLTWLALENPDAVKALVLLSPAFGVSRLAHHFARAGHFLGYNPVVGGRALSARAGLQVVTATTEFQRWIEARGGDRFVAQALKEIPVWIGNTNHDLIIDKSAAQTFFQKLQSENIGTARREEYWAPFRHFVSHDLITSKNQRHFPSMKQSIEKFLRLNL